ISTPIGPPPSTKPFPPTRRGACWSGSNGITPRSMVRGSISPNWRSASSPANVCGAACRIARPSPARSPSGWPSAIRPTSASTGASLSPTRASASPSSTPCPIGATSPCHSTQDDDPSAPPRRRSSFYPLPPTAYRLPLNHHILHLRPVLPGTDVDRQRHAQRDDVLHRVADEAGDGVEIGPVQFQHQFVVDLEQDAGAQAGAAQFGREADHRQFHDVG